VSVKELGIAEERLAVDMEGDRGEQARAEWGGLASRGAAMQEGVAVAEREEEPA
jgi:hypothetical protein